MKDILQELRDYRPGTANSDINVFPFGILKRAAAEIEYLRREIKVLRQLDGFVEKQVIDHGTRHP